MPSTTDVERPEAALDLVERYSRRERSIGWFVAVLAGIAILGTAVATSLVPAVVAGGALVVLARAPVLRSGGTFRLRTDEDPESVVDAFTGPTSPVLAFQWGVADEIARVEGTATYAFSYAFGLKSVEMTVDARSEDRPDGQHRVTLDVATDGRPWATYVATIGNDGDRTTIDVEYESNRRFGLRRLPQQLLAKRYRDDALAAQGYAVVERDAGIGR